MNSSEPTNTPVRVALIQMRCSDDKSENVAKAIKMIGEAAAQGGQVICLQELFHGQYPCQSEDHDRFKEAEPIPGPTSDALSAAAKQHGVCVVGSIFEKRAPGLFHNSAAVLDTDGSMAGMYRKMHIPDDPLYYEKFYFTPGDLGFQSIETQFAKCGVCICWDQWFPEAARLTAMHGAEILFYPTAIGWLPDEKETFGASQRDAWMTMMRSHAIANGLFVAAVNRVGREGEIEFWGRSFVADPYGNVIAQADTDDDEIIFADCDFSLINTARTHWPFFRDRRIDAYSDLNQRFLDSPARPNRNQP
ncbi:MAG: carbon-nitrogen hydrolase [bacterium]|nr:carbon-nitrogen hydrolase [bacterium]